MAEIFISLLRHQNCTQTQSSSCHTIHISGKPKCHPAPRGTQPDTSKEAKLCLQCQRRSKQQQQRQLFSTTNNATLKRPESLVVKINPTWPAFLPAVEGKTTFSVTWHLGHKDRGSSPSRHTSTALTAFLRGHNSRKLDKMLNSYAGLDVCSFPEISRLSQAIPNWPLRDKNDCKVSFQ